MGKGSKRDWVSVQHLRAVECLSPRRSKRVETAASVTIDLAPSASAWRRDRFKI